MQIAEYTIPSLIKIAEPKKLFTNKEKLRWVELCEKIGNECGLSELDRIIVVRQMVDNGQLTEEFGSFVLNFYLQKNLSEFEQTQQRLIDAYFSKPFSEVDAKVKRVLFIEQKQLENTKLIANGQMEYGSRKKPVFKVKEVN